MEVTNLNEAIVWASAGADILQLEKFTPEAFAECRIVLERAGLRTVLAAAGGIRADNAADNVTAGASLLVTSAPYTARPKDVQVIFFASY